MGIYTDLGCPLCALEGLMDAPKLAPEFSMCVKDTLALREVCVTCCGPETAWKEVHRDVALTGLARHHSGYIEALSGVIFNGEAPDTDAGPMNEDVAARVLPLGARAVTGVGVVEAKREVKTGARVEARYPIDPLRDLTVALHALGPQDSTLGAYGPGPYESLSRAMPTLSPDLDESFMLKGTHKEVSRWP